MTKIESKSIQHVVDILDNIDTHKLYSEIGNILEDFGITTKTHEFVQIKDKIYNKFIEINYEKTKEAKTWLNAILEDKEDKK